LEESNLGWWFEFAKELLSLVYIGQSKQFAIRELQIIVYLCHLNRYKMKKHNGMRPHDLVILLKIAAKGSKPWLMKDLAIELGISAGEVSESLHRSAYAGFISENKKKLMHSAILEFLQYGLKYVYPVRVGSLVRGMPTAHSAPPLSTQIISTEAIVWPFADGTVRGQALEPLYAAAPKACEQDNSLYELLALADALRIGKTRERTLAVEELKKRFG